MQKYSQNRFLSLNKGIINAGIIQMIPRSYV